MTDKLEFPCVPSPDLTALLPSPEATPLQTLCGSGLYLYTETIQLGGLEYGLWIHTAKNNNLCKLHILPMP